MRAFQRANDGASLNAARFTAVFEPEEAQLLTMLAGQIAELIETRDADADPAVLRLLPDAYPEDAEASSEFRRFTADGLANRKLVNASRVTEALMDAAASTSATELILDEPTALAWLRSLTDIRLTIAVRLGIEKDADVGTGDPQLVELYDWLGFVQGTLVEALDN